MRLFSKKFECLKRVPLSSFLIFCYRIYGNKARRVPPFTFFGTMRHFLKKQIKNFKFFSNFFLCFLSLRYSADFRRSRLVKNFSGYLVCYNRENIQQLLNSVSRMRFRTISGFPNKHFPSWLQNFTKISKFSII